jgi:hypothetical protein
MYEIATALAMWFVFSIWTSDGMMNLSVKFTFLSLAIWGTIRAAELFGYVITT